MRATTRAEDDLYRTALTRTAAVALFSTATFLLPRTEPIRWAAAVPAVALLVAGGVVSLATRRPWRPDSWGWWVPLAQQALALTGAGFAGVAVGGIEGNQRFLLLLILVVNASYSPPAIVATGCALATVTVFWSAALSGTPVDIALTVTVMFGASAAAIVSVVHLLLNRIRRQHRQVRLIATLAAAVARAGSIERDLPDILALTSRVLAESPLAMSRVEADRSVSALGMYRPPTRPRGRMARLAGMLRLARVVPFSEEVLVTVIDGAPHVLVVQWPSAAARRRVEPQTVAIVRDLLGHFVDRSHLIARLEHHSRTDPLTGLGNRRALASWLADHDSPVTVVIFDLDHFKGFNDAYGHVAGDQLLRRFALVLQQHVRRGDCAVRLGGEEFCVALATTDVEVAARYAARVRDAFAADSGGVTFSGGVAVAAPNEQAESVLARADAALYEAKRAGRNRTVVAT